MKCANTFILRALCLLFLLALIGGAPAHAADRPNIITVYVDDLAYGDVGAFGCPDPGTPNIDRLAIREIIDYCSSRRVVPGTCPISKSSNRIAHPDLRAFLPPQEERPSNYHLSGRC